MLQINTGKLFVREPEYINKLRGVLYSNLQLIGIEEIETEAGTLLSAGSSARNSAIVYELTERIERRSDGPGVLLSHCVEPYAQDFAVVVSFALNVLCTTDFETTERLSSGRAGPSNRYPPRQLVRRFFDEKIVSQKDDVDQLTRFVEQLLALERKSFLGAMRAMRTYVVALHRIADDLELAYTLLVASIESLAQTFDSHEAVWDDIDDSKRCNVDKALADAPEHVAQRVRSAILQSEHVKLARRFRNFTLSLIDPSYFRMEAPIEPESIGRRDLTQAIDKAYKLRSAYVHMLLPLPWTLSVDNSYRESSLEDGVPTLTFQGLTRLVRHVIFNFVQRQPKTERELYDYSLERSGVVLARLAPQYWVGRIDEMTPDVGMQKFEGFLEQITAHLLRTKDAPITDLRDVLRTIAPKFPSLRTDERIPFLGLFYCFDYFVRREDRMNENLAMWQKFAGELNAASSVSIFVHLLLDRVPHWPLEEHEQTLESYFRSRSKRQGLRAPPTLEAAAFLVLAERYRSDGDWPKAKVHVANAVDNLPSHASLRKFETMFNGAEFIRWQAILLPAT